MAENTYTVKDLASMLKVAESWVYERTRKGLIPHLRVGKYIRFTESHVQQYFESLKSKTETN